MGPIFLSYAGTDREVATRLKEGLAAAGADIWQDVDQIRLGDNWIDTLQAALSECSAYAILIGSGGVQRWVKAELSIAIKRHFDSSGAFPIYPFLLTDVAPEDLPPFLSIFQAERLKLEPLPADYQRLAGWLSHGQESVSAATTEALSTICPFPGLEAYDEDTAQFFFGRQAETLEALALLGRSRDGVYRRWLQVEGPSGGGKSSLVKAGMIPAIRRGWIEEQGERTARNWQIAIMRPGSAPIDNLAAALGPALGMAGDTPWLGKLVGELKRGPDALRYLLRERVPETGRFLLLVDQFEELFTLTQDTHRTQRERFEALLASALQDGNGPFHLITTIRSDFTLRLGELPRLESLLNSRAERYYLKRIDGNALRDVVRTPARLAGLAWDEPTLPDRIVADAAGEPSPLPLVSNLLRLLWQRRVGNELCAGVYGELSGVGGALARSADGLLEGLGPEGARRAQGLHQLEAEEALEEAAWRWQQAGQPWLPGVPARVIRRRYRRARAPSTLAQAYRRSVGLESGLRRTALGLALGLITLGVVWMLANELNFNHVWAMGLSHLPGGLYDVYEPEMVPIPMDKFAPDQPWMGSVEGDSEAYGNEQRQHAVTFQRPFAIGKYEVTWEQYARFAYADWLSDMTEKRYRLPTEAEWEYAARAGTLTPRFWGDDPKDACTYANVADQSVLQKYSIEIHDCDDGYIETAEVDAEGFEPNPFGLYHMLGNVWEWTCSEYVGEYDGAEQVCVSNNHADGRRVIRGGSWLYKPATVRSATRDRFTPATRYNTVGFRLAQDL